MPVPPSGIWASGVGVLAFGVSYGLGSQSLGRNEWKPLEVLLCWNADTLPKTLEIGARCWHEVWYEEASCI